MNKSNNNFSVLLYDKNILKAIKDMNITTPTEVQKKAIPLILNNKNIIAESATGTGKTIAFLASILSKITNKKKVQALVIVPTRELAIQVYDEAKKLLKYKKICALAVYGGESISEQAKKLKDTDIVIGTPGRLIDHIYRENLFLNDTEYLILDEADRMCDMGFLNDIEIIINNIKKIKQILLFSATITKDVKNIEKKYIKSYEKISVESKVNPKHLLQEYYVVNKNERYSLLFHLIKNVKQKSIVFCNTKKDVDFLHNVFLKNNLEVFKLHGDLEQRKRTYIIEKFHSLKHGVLISSDVAARGIHIDDLDVIYNYEIPNNDVQYVHRIGRTARAGKKGKAISIITKDQEIDFLKLCKKYDFFVKKINKPNFKILNLNLKKNKFDQKKDFFNTQLGFLKKQTFVRKK